MLALLSEKKILVLETVQMYNKESNETMLPSGVENIPSETLKECNDESCSLFSSVRFKQVRMSTSFRKKISGSWSYVIFSGTEPQPTWWMEKKNRRDEADLKLKRAFA